MTRLNLALNGPERAINFAQGFPDFQTDPRILEFSLLFIPLQKVDCGGYARGTQFGIGQWAICWGLPQTGRPTLAY